MGKEKGAENKGGNETERLIHSAKQRNVIGFKMSHVHPSFWFVGFKNRKLTHYIYLKYIYFNVQFSGNTCTAMN